MKVRVQRVKKDLLCLDFENDHWLYLRFGWEKGELEDDPENLEIVTDKAGFFYGGNDPNQGWLNYKKYSKLKAFLNSLQREIPKFCFPWDNINGVEDLDPVSYEAWAASRQIFIDLGRELFAKFGMNYDDVGYGDDVDNDRCPPTIIEI